MKKQIFLSFILFGFFAGAMAQDSTSLAVSAINKTYVTVPTTAASGLRLNGSWTLECMVYLDSSILNNQVHLIESYSSGAGGYVLRLSNKKVHAYVMDGGQSQQLVGVTEAKLGQWNHVAATFNEATKSITLYLNGENDKSQTFGSINQNSTSGILRIGARGDDAAINYAINMDEVKVWGVARTEQQIKDNMTKCLLGTEGDLLLYYDFENNSNDSITDRSGNGNNGEVKSPALGYTGEGAFECIKQTNSTKTKRQINSITAYPNPTSSKLTIENKNKTIKNVVILNLTGNIVMEINDHTNKIDVSKLNTGLYLLQVDYGSSIGHSRFIKN